MTWTLENKRMNGQKGYKRKDDPQQMSPREKYAYEEWKDHNNDNPYVQDYIKKTHLAGCLVRSRGASRTQQVHPKTQR